MEQLLESIGLSDKEANAYLTLLRHGTRSISFLAQKAELNRGTAYVALHSLLKKGLVTKSSKQKVLYFTAREPDSLVQYLDHREKEVQSQRQRVKESMTALLRLVNPLTSLPKIQFFEGTAGARSVLNTTLEAEDKTLRAFLSLADIIDRTGADWFHDYTQRRIKTGYTLLAIRTLENDREALRKSQTVRSYVTSKKQQREIRFAPEELAFPVTMYMFDNKLAILASKAEDFSVLIESRELMEMQKKLFQLLWNLLPIAKA